MVIQRMSAAETIAEAGRASDSGLGHPLPLNALVFPQRRDEFGRHGGQVGG